MSALTARAPALAAALLLAWTPAEAQESPTPGGGRRVAITATVHAGGIAFTRFQNVTVEAPAAPEPSYPASIAASTAASLGADLTVWFAPWLGARLHFVYAPSSFELRLAEEDRTEVLGEDADYQGLDYSDLSLFSMTVSAVLALPIASTHVAPYALFGAGGSILSADARGAQGLDSAFQGQGISIRAIGVAGIGLKIPLEEAGISLSFELTDHVAISPIGSNDDRVLLDTGELRVVNRAHARAVDTNAHYVHAVGIAAGMSFATGRATAPVRATD